MTKQTTRNFTGNEIAGIVQSAKLLQNLSIKKLGAKNAHKLNQLVIKCTTIFNEIMVDINQFVGEQNESFITDSILTHSIEWQDEQHKTLIQEFFKVRHDMVASNKFMNEHKELEYLIPKLIELNNKTTEYQNIISDKVHELSYTIENNSLENAINELDPTIEQVTPILFLFD